jgi:hypothetical protein
LTTVSFESGSQLTSIGPFLFENSGLATITIPSSVTSMGNYAFYLCSSLTSVSFESGSQLTSIGQHTFRQSGLTTITIPSLVTSMGNYAFDECSSLTSVIFESGSQLTSIGEYALYQSGLTTITIPASVTSIGNYAFQQCSSLSSVIFESESQLTSIGQSVFRHSGLTTITIPASVTSISTYAFFQCYSLTSVIFESGSQLESIGSGAFNSTDLTTITLPVYVTSIDNHAFYNNSSLTSLIVGLSLPSFGVNSLLDTSSPLTLTISPFTANDSNYTDGSTVTLGNKSVTINVDGSLNLLPLSMNDFSIQKESEETNYEINLEDYTNLDDRAHDLSYQLVSSVTITPNINVWMRDKYGDGWNGGSITITDSVTGNLVFSSDGPTSSNSRSWIKSEDIDAGTYNIEWVGGIWPNEIQCFIATTEYNFDVNATTPPDTNAASGVLYSVNGTNLTPAVISVSIDIIVTVTIDGISIAGSILTLNTNEFSNESFLVQATNILNNEVTNAANVQLLEPDP